MSNARWLGVFRWVHVLLVWGYVLITIMILIVMLAVFGVRMANWERWAILMGWFALCFGGVFLVEWTGLFFGQGCRMPIRSEAERLTGLMVDVQNRVASIENVVPQVEVRTRFLIRSVPEKRDASFGIRTIIISSGTLTMASDEELRGILAHELGHLRDGDRILETAFFYSGVFALGFRFACRLIRRRFRVNMAGGLLLLAIFSPVLLSLFFFYGVDTLFRVLKWGLTRLEEFRQDWFTARCGYGKGLRDWLEKSGLAANVHRIRRLEKLVDLGE